MISKSQSTEYKLKNNGNSYGTIRVSHNIDDIKKYKIPFIKKEKLVFVKIGNGDYSDFDSFIIASLNDYFLKLSSPSDLETKENMLDNYTKLYGLWTKICENKETNNVVSLQDYYDKISYGLYLLGYTDNNL